MAKGRRKGMRKAYLKHSKSFYDPYSPYSLKTRGAKSINLGAITITRDKDGKSTGVTAIAYADVTLTTGKRGLTMARGEGPVQVAIHADGRPTVIPRAQVAKRILEHRAQELTQTWSNWRRNGVSNFQCLTLRNVPGLDKMELWFANSQWRFVKTNYRRRTEARSKVYSSRAEAMQAWLTKPLPRIYWEEVLPLPPPGTVAPA